MAIERSVLYATTDDGLRLAVDRVRPEGGATRGALVLLHGLGSNNLLFLVPGASLAEHLAERGFDCFVPELRGAGKSQAPKGAWTLDDYLERDIPALLAAVLEASGESEVHWVGHSLGGILMMMYGIEHPDAPVTRLVAVGSALDYRPGRNVYQDVRKLRPLAGPLPLFPFGLIARALSPLAGVGPLLPPESINFQRSNVERSVTRAIMARGFATIPFPLFDSLTTTFNPEGFSRDQGRVVYLERVSEFRIPTLLVAGSRDVQCPPTTARATLDYLVNVKEKRALFVGKKFGQPDDYGHLDLLVGKRAPAEVWPEIAAFVGAEPDASEGGGRAGAQPR